MAVTPWLASYPFSDPIFQNFNVQQYTTVSGVVAQPGLFTEKAPEKPAEDEKKAGK